MSNLTKKTERRLDQTETELKRVEADTYWKIKDYENLLAARPTLQYVRSAMEEEGRNVFIRARVYVDDELEKLKLGSKNMEQKMKQFSMAFNGDLRDMGNDIKDFNDKLKAQNKSLKGYTNRIETSIL